MFTVGKNTQQFSGDQLTLTFSFKEGQMPKEPSSFSFNLTVPGDSETGTYTAVLNPEDLPVAIASAHDAVQGRELRQMLTGEFADTFALASQPLHGKAVLVDEASGAFTYTADAGYLGKDSFTFIAINEFGESDPATVTLEVDHAVCDFTGTYTYESSTPEMSLQYYSASITVDENLNFTGTISIVVDESINNLSSRRYSGTAIASGRIIVGAVKAAKECFAEAAGVYTYTLSDAASGEGMFQDGSVQSHFEGLQMHMNGEYKGDEQFMINAFKGVADPYPENF